MTLCVIDGKQCQCQPDDGVACDAGTPAQVQAALNLEVMALRKDAERFRLMRENIDVTDNGDGTGHYWHNQRGEFSFEYRRNPDGWFRPTFESVIDAAIQARRIGAA